MRFACAVLAASLVAGVSCAASAAAASHEITVGAAASLSVVFQQVGHAFERTHPGTSIRFTFSSSNGLATQIQQGAPIDVFASAAPRWMDAVEKDPGVLARAVGTVPIPEEDNVVAVYDIGVVRGTKTAALARAFVAYVTGPGQAILQRAGFEAPA